MTQISLLLKLKVALTALLALLQAQVAVFPQQPVPLGGIESIQADLTPIISKIDRFEVSFSESIPYEGAMRAEMMKDRPEVVLSKWNDEVRLGVEYKKVTAHAQKLVSSNEVKWGAGNEVVHAYKKDDDNFEIEIELKSKPATNVFDFTIDGAEDLDFFFQSDLTPEKVASGMRRSENVVGSYAVYHRTRQGHKIGGINYATGKAFHIYRPKAIDANGAETWADLLYENGVLSVTVPQEFLNDAVYPVVVDPTIGYTSIGASDIQFAYETNDVSFAPSRVGEASITDYIFSTAGAFTWVAPAGVSSANVSCWGGGGGGDSVSTSAGGGGGGGAFASGTLTVVPGDSYTVTVGVGGQGGTTSPTAGGDSSFASTTNMLLAKGGAEATDENGGLGGASSTSIGTTVYRGGNGGAANSIGDTGGGGGGSAGPSGEGGDGSNGTTTVGGGGGEGDGGADGVGSVGGTGGPGGDGGTGDSNGSASPGGGVGGNAVTGGGGGGGGDDGDPGGGGGTPGGGGGGGETLLASADGDPGKCIVSVAVQTITGNLDSISLYLRRTTSSNSVEPTIRIKSFISEAEGGGAGTHSQLISLAETEDIAINTSTVGWHTITAGSESFSTGNWLVNAVAITTSTDTSGGKDSALLIATDSYPGRTYKEDYGDRTSYDTPESPWTQAAVTTARYSIYATYTVVAGAAAPTTRRRSIIIFDE